MSGLLYFLPNASGASEARLRGLGLGHLAEVGDLESRGVTGTGPGGQSGLLVAPGSPKGSRAQGAHWARFKWEQSPLSEAWVGWDPESPPAPEDLERAETFDGHAVKLADGREWLVPVARAVNGATPLPRSLKLTKDGWAPGDVQPRYRDLFGRACELWDALTEQSKEGGGKVTMGEARQLVVDALSINYLLSAAEVSILGLLDTRCEGEAVLALVDWPALLGLQEPRPTAKHSSAPGALDSSPTTTQQSVS